MFFSFLKKGYKINAAIPLLSDRKIHYFVQCVNIFPKSLRFENETHLSVNVLNVHITTQLLVFQHNCYGMLLFY